jgi:hypothetical protein
VSQEADKISWIVANGTSASNFTMTQRAISIVAENIDLTGYVTISALRGSGTTIINGDNITAGYISADRISAGTLDGFHIIGSTIDSTDGLVSVRMSAEL